MNWYPFVIADYLVDTAHLTNEQDLCYRRLLDTYYTTEKPLTLDLQSLARRVRVSVEDCQLVLIEYFNQQADGWHHARVDAELHKYHVKSARNKGNAEKRWAKPEAESCDSHATGMPLACDSDATGMRLDATRMRLGSDSHATGMRTQCKKNIEKREEEKSTEIQRVASAPVRRVAVERPAEVSEQVWADFLTHRRNRKAPLTETALKSIQSEAQKAGKGLEKALETMISRGWTGYKADWEIADSRPQNGRLTGRQQGTTHIPNMPLGATGCSCPECVAYRNKQTNSKQSQYNPNL